MRWLELGLTRLEIEAIKARGVSQLLAQFQETMESVAPPDLSDAAERIRPAWSRQLSDEAEADASVLLNTLDPYQKEIEHHFSSERQQHFGGLMSWYLQLFNKLRYTGSTLRDQLPYAAKRPVEARRNGTSAALPRPAAPPLPSSICSHGSRR